VIVVEFLAVCNVIITTNLLVAHVRSYALRTLYRSLHRRSNCSNDWLSHVDVRVGHTHRSVLTIDASSEEAAANSTTDNGRGDKRSFQAEFLVFGRGVVLKKLEILTSF